MVARGESYRLLEQLGREVNSDGTPGAPLFAGSVGTVKQLDDRTAVLDFRGPGEQDNELGLNQPRRSVSFPLQDLDRLFERVEGD